MQSSQLTPKRQHYNRFAYLLEPNKDGQKPTIQKDFNFFNINPCFLNICKSKQASSQVNHEQNMLSSQLRKPLKYQLKSQKFEIFKGKIDKKSSFNSFLAYTPQKSQIKDQFSIYNDISTIQYSKSNQMHTHRNLFESIVHQETQSIPFFSSESINQSVKHSLRVSTQNGEEAEPFVRTKPHQNQLIKLELSESDDQSKESDTRFLKKHLRTMTQGSYDYTKHNQYKKENNISTAEKSARFHEFIHKSQLESIEVSEPSKNDSIEYFLIQEALNTKDNKWTGMTMATLKTKKMSQRLQDSCEFGYQNAIAVSPKNSQLSSVLGYPKKIRLGRKTINKF